MLTETLSIGGMSCAACSARIERTLKSTAGVQTVEVDYITGKAKVTYDASEIGFAGIVEVIESLGYQVLKPAVAGSLPAENEKTRFLRIAGMLVIILALYVLLRAFGTSALVAAFPLAREGMGYGMLFVIGLITSVHCVAMCGGINLSQTLVKTGTGNEAAESGTPSLPLLPCILYNGGRVISYTGVGVVVGALGSVITLDGRFQGIVLLIAGIFMAIMGINMLGLFPGLRRLIPRMPKMFAGQENRRGPLVVGILNGFMPCSPLQAMQLYALSTGSPIRGGLSMFLFCVGTIPLMFALGAASGALSGVKGRAFSHRVMQAGAVLVAAMGLTMFANGWNLAGFNSPFGQMAAFSGSASKTADGTFVPVIQDGIQIVNSTLLPNRYPAITVQQGIPVRWTIDAPLGSINGCNNRIIIREYGIEHSFTPGNNVIEFIPAKTGKFSYSCWMGMIRSTITVVAEGESIANVPAPNTTPVPAGVQIPTDAVALAQVKDNFQTVTIRLGEDGFEPAIVVMQRNVPALWIINLDSSDPGNSRIVFPAYYTQVNTRQGNNTIQIIPDADFDFSTGDNVFYGYVKVINDINNVNIEAIKEDVANHETLVYPDAYFEEAAANSGGSCCSGS